MKRFVYGLGTALGILSILIFVSRPRDPRLDLSFSLFWLLVIVALIFDFRKEMLRHERIQRNINVRTTRYNGSFQV